MKKIGILILTFLVFYHIPLEVYSASVMIYKDVNMPFNETNTSDELFFDISNDVVCDPLIHDSEFRNINANLGCVGQNDVVISSLKFNFLSNIPFHFLSRSSSDIVMKSILSAIKFCIPDSSLISLLDNHFSFRI